MSSCLDQQDVGSAMPITFAVIGGGVIGGGWIARFLLMGCDVNIYDPDPEAERKVKPVSYTHLTLPTKRIV